MTPISNPAHLLKRDSKAWLSKNEPKLPYHIREELLPSRASLADVAQGLALFASYVDKDGQGNSRHENKLWQLYS